jgi:hypothetical protein
MWEVPWDAVLFAAVVMAFFLIGLPMITRRVSVPRKIVFESVADHDLTANQSRFFADLDPRLLEMGYRPVGDRRTVNMQGKALIRTYMCEADPAVIMMNLLTSEVEGTGEHPMNYLEIVTRCADGTTLSTRNAEISEVLATAPMHIVQERKGVVDPAKLKLAHDARARDLMVHEPLFSRPDEFERAFDEFHERWCRHQIDRGLLVPRSDDPEQLRPTVKAGLRGIANFVNPLADNFTLPRFLLTVTLGLTVPVVALLWLDGPGSWLVARLAAATGLSPAACLTGCLAVVVTGVGALVGHLFLGKSFIWGFLVTYVVLRAIGPTGGWMAATLSLWTGIVASWASARRERHHRLA